MTLDKESMRCLRILADKPAQLEWPCRNSSIPWLIQKGFAAKGRSYQAWWGGSLHDVAEILITKAGLDAVTNGNRTEGE